MYLLYNVFMSSYNTKNRHKFLLQYHLIFVCKYRHSLLKNKLISDDIKKFSLETSIIAQQPKHLEIQWLNLVKSKWQRFLQEE